MGGLPARLLGAGAVSDDRHGSRPSGRHATATRALLLLAACSSAACVVRTERGEHYVGPVLVRATDACRGGSTVVQSVQAGVFGEVGRQNGVAVGVAQRVALAPVTTGPREAQCDRWTVVAGVPGDVGPDHWTFSPFYARRDAAAPPELVWRLLVGAQATGGTEQSAVSVGAVSGTELRPRRDGVYRLCFDSTRPMATRFRTWPYQPGTPIPADEIIEEGRDDGCEP